MPSKGGGRVQMGTIAQKLSALGKKSLGEVRLTHCMLMLTLLTPCSAPSSEKGEAEDCLEGSTPYVRHVLECQCISSTVYHTLNNLKAVAHLRSERRDTGRPDVSSSKEEDVALLTRQGFARDIPEPCPVSDMFFSVDDIFLFYYLNLLFYVVLWLSVFFSLSLILRATSFYSCCPSSHPLLGLWLKKHRHARPGLQNKRQNLKNLKTEVTEEDSKEDSK